MNARLVAAAVLAFVGVALVGTYGFFLAGIEGVVVAATSFWAGTIVFRISLALE